MDYGIILEDYRPDIDEMYKAFSAYLNNPKLTKLKDVDKYSMYITKNYCLLSNQCRYIIVLIDKNIYNVGHTEYLENMKWKSLQTRTLSDKYDLPSHSYTATRNTPLACPIKRTEFTNYASTYKCDKYPITITLLHTKTDSVNNPEFEYQENGIVISALETFQTIITIN